MRDWSRKASCRRSSARARSPACTGSRSIPAATIASRRRLHRRGRHPRPVFHARRPRLFEPADPPASTRRSSTSAGGWPRCPSSERSRLSRVPRYVAFLRAVNVGGRTIKMERLREVFTAAGLHRRRDLHRQRQRHLRFPRQHLPALERKIEAALSPRSDTGRRPSVRRGRTSRPSRSTSRFPWTPPARPSAPSMSAFSVSAPDAANRRQL